MSQRPNTVGYMVCIHCMTYNQEKYLADALEGFVMQKTNFPFIAVVIDDFSTDGTADILRKYEKQYPEIIKAVYLKENYYSQHKSKREFLDPWDNQSKYIALCEGDDYWTDPNKLQKQVDFLNTHPEYSICFHRSRVLEQKTGTFRKESVRDLQGESTIYDMAVGNYVHTPSVVYRNLAKIREDRQLLPIDLPVGDYVLWLLLTQYGNIWKMEDEMCTYREGVGCWSSKPCSYVQPRWVELLHHLISFFENRNRKVAALLIKQMRETVEIPMRDYEIQVDKLNKELSNIRKSHAYRIGKTILSPLKAIRKL